LSDTDDPSTAVRASLSLYREWWAPAVESADTSVSSDAEEVFEW
jgi:hypothetical protein